MFESFFRGDASAKVRSGDSISCEVDGVTYRATIQRDDDMGAPWDNFEGFWPSLDKSSPGWIGDNPSKSFDEQMADCKAVQLAFRQRKMIYCGVILTAERNGIPLIDRYSVALWGVDCNWPNAKGEFNNAYLRSVANELLDEAKEAARKTIAAKLKTARDLVEKLEG